MNKSNLHPEFVKGKSVAASGITLVALVVTIIVLLILAGVSLNLISGSDGILGKVSAAADKNNVAKAGEEVELLIAELQSEYFEKVYVNRDKTVTEHSADEYVIAHLDGETTASGYTVDVDGLKLSIKNGSDVIATNEFESATSAKLKNGWTGDKKGKTSGGSSANSGNQSGGNSDPEPGAEPEPGPINPPAPEEYTIAYNKNSGTDTVSNMPNSQTKIEGENLTLSSSAPTRYGYMFKGWSTTPTGTVVYQPGSNYTTNAEQTLYAIWKVGYEYDGQYTFTGSNYIDTGVKLFSSENANKNFEISFKIDVIENWYNTSEPYPIANIFNAMSEVGTPWPGLTFRRDWMDHDLTEHPTFSKGCLGIEANNGKNESSYKAKFIACSDNVKYSFIRINNVIYYSKNDGGYTQIRSFSNFSSYINTPVTFGCSLDDNNQPFRFMRGKLSDMKILLGDDVITSNYNI